MSGWDITLVYIRGPSGYGVENCVGTSVSEGTYIAVYGTIRLGYCGITG